MNITPLEPDNRIQLPPDWVRDLGLQDYVALERTGNGILVRPYPRAAWDEISATKLIVRSAPTGPDDDDAERTGDDLLF